VTTLSFLFGIVDVRKYLSGERQAIPLDTRPGRRAANDPATGLPGGTTLDLPDRVNQLESQAASPRHHATGAAAVVQAWEHATTGGSARLFSYEDNFGQVEFPIMIFRARAFPPGFPSVEGTHLYSH